MSKVEKDTKKYTREYNGPDAFLYGNLKAQEYATVSNSVMAAAVIAAGVDLYRQNMPLLERINDIATKGLAATAAVVHEASTMRNSQVLDLGIEQSAEQTVNYAKTVLKDVSFKGNSKWALGVVALATVGTIIAPIVGQKLGERHAKNLQRNHNAMLDEIDSLEDRIEGLKASAVLKADVRQDNLQGTVTDRSEIKQAVV